MIACVGSRGLFQLRNNAQGIPVVFMLIPQKENTVQCSEDNGGVEEGHVKQRLVRDHENQRGQGSHDAWKHVKPNCKWKEVSAKFEAAGAVVKEKHVAQKVAGRFRREKLNSTQWSWTKNKKKGFEAETGLQNFVKKRRRMKQGASLKRCNATLIPPRKKL